MAKSPLKPFTFERTIAFSDTDMAGIVHFSSLLDYVEEAEHAMFFQAGIPPIGAGILWPRLRLEVDFMAPARFGQKVKIEFPLVRIGTSSLTFEFRIFIAKQLCCQGKWVICHSKMGEDGKIHAERIPADYLAIFEKYLV